MPIKSFSSFSSFDLNDELQNIAESLDIPPAVAEQAVSTYDDVAEWLGKEDSPLRDYSPSIYPQGSFRLGTIIRPIAREAGFDVDLVLPTGSAQGANDPGGSQEERR